MRFLGYPCLSVKQERLLYVWQRLKKLNKNIKRKKSNENSRATEQTFLKMFSFWNNSYHFPNGHLNCQHYYYPLQYYFLQINKISTKTELH